MHTDTIGQPVGQFEKDVSGFVLWLVSACFFLSGFAALVYQIVWLRQFSVIFGTSELAVAIVLASYMGGLAFGAMVVGKVIHRLINPIRVYGVLEAGIALSALAVPFLLSGASDLLVYILGKNPDLPASSSLAQVFFYLVTSFLILAVPTGFMGATLPLLIRGTIRFDHQVGPRVASLYAINALGAVAGAVTTAFLFLPQLGMTGAVWIGVVGNIAVFLLALKIPLVPEVNDVNGGRKLPFSGSQEHTRKGGTSDRALSPRHTWVLPLMLASGSNTFLYEVLWTRLLNHVLGGSLYAFATMLATFLTGIALGSTFGSYFARDRKKAIRHLAVIQLLIAVLSMVVYRMLDELVPVERNLMHNLMFAASVLLPATLFIGATFPVAVRILSRNQYEAGKAAAQVYAWNTCGAIIGAIAAGFYLIPAFGYEGAIKYAVIINTILAAVSFGFSAGSRLFKVAVSGALCTSAIVFYHPERPKLLSLSGSIARVGEQEAEKEIFFAVGRSSTVQVLAQGGSYNIRTNGLPEATVRGKGAPPFTHLQKWLTALPVIARPDAQNMLVIGFGGGVALEGVPPTLKAIDVVELEPEVVHANKSIAGLREKDPLQDERITVVYNDARNALKLTSRAYDIIVSQPSHPWTAGASHLFTLEFLELAKRHLNPEGVFLQWMNINFMDAGLLRSLTATLNHVYQYVRLYHVEEGGLFFLASDAPLKVEQDVARTLRPFTDAPMHYAALGLNNVEDLLAVLAMGNEPLRAFAEGAPLTTDNHNRMAMESKYFGDGLTQDEFLELIAPYDPLRDRESWIYRGFKRHINFPYIARKWMRTGFRKKANALANTIDDQSTAHLIHALGLTYTGRSKEALDFIKSSLMANPDNMQARFMLAVTQMDALLSGNADSWVNDQVGRLSGPSAAVVAGWYYSIEQNWAALARLDQALAISKQTDLWYSDAVQLRAEWRTKVSVSDAGVGYATDALTMLDRALVLDQNFNLFLLRAGAGVLIRNLSVFLETTYQVNRYANQKLQRAESGDYRMDPQECRMLFDRLTGIQQTLSTGFVPAGTEHAEALSAEIGQTLNALKKSTRRADSC